MDDFSFKERHTYGTIVVDETTHKPVAILDGRDGKTLKEWLSKNKHVKAVTRDRASAYSAAIKEILPVDIRIPSDSNSIGEPSVENDSKKNAMQCG